MGGAKEPPEIKQRRDLYDRPSCKESVFGKMLAMCNERTYLYLSLCGMKGGRNAAVDLVYSQLFFVFFLHLIKGHRPRNFHIFVVFFCFAVCHKEWPKSIERTNDLFE